MEKHSHRPDGPTAAPAVLKPAARARVNLRAQELARLAGRTPPLVSQSDYERAKQELTGESDWEQQNAILDALPGAGSRQAPETLNEDEDAEGRSTTEQMAEGGAEAALQEQIHQAAIRAHGADRRKL